jgi:hypothetical protein
MDDGYRREWIEGMHKYFDFDEIKYLERVKITCGRLRSYVYDGWK